MFGKLPIVPEEKQREMFFSASSNLPASKSYLVCVEPQTHRTFLLNIGEETVTTVKILNENVGLGLENKIRREEYKMDALLTRASKEADWNFDSADANRYRRRMLPFYLLEKESSACPVYIDNSDLKVQ
jgi:hypothetical protein